MPSGRGARPPRATLPPVLLACLVAALTPVMTDMSSPPPTTPPVLLTCLVAELTPVMTDMSSPPPIEKGTLLFLTCAVATLLRECIPVAPVMPVMTELSSSTTPAITKLLFTLVWGLDLPPRPPPRPLAEALRCRTLRRWDMNLE